MDYFPYDYYHKRIETECDIHRFNGTQIIGRKKYEDIYFSGRFDYWQDTPNITNKIINEGKAIDVSARPALIRGIEFFTANHKNRYRDYDWIFPLREVEFEGYRFFAPNDCDKYLKSVYGEKYMNFPKGIHAHIDFNKLEDKMYE